MNRKSPRIRFDDGPAGFCRGRRCRPVSGHLAGGGPEAGARDGDAALRGLHAGLHLRGAFAALTRGAVVRRRRRVPLLDPLAHRTCPLVAKTAFNITYITILSIIAQ